MLEGRWSPCPLGLQHRTPQSHRSVPAIEDRLVEADADAPLIVARVQLAGPPAASEIGSRLSRGAASFRRRGFRTSRATPHNRAPIRPLSERSAHDTQNEAVGSDRIGKGSTEVAAGIAINFAPVEAKSRIVHLLRPSFSDYNFTVEAVLQIGDRPRRRLPGRFEDGAKAVGLKVRVAIIGGASVTTHTAGGRQ